MLYVSNATFFSFIGLPLFAFLVIQSNPCPICGESGYESGQLWNRTRLVAYIQCIHVGLTI